MFPDERFRHLREELRDSLIQLTAANSNSMRHYKRRWDEDRGDEYAAWGCSDYYFEVAPDGTVTRHMEVYDNGSVLQYHAHHIEDAFGFLTDQPLDHSEYAPFSISRQEFETAWTSHPPTNSQ